MCSVDGTVQHAKSRATSADRQAFNAIEKVSGQGQVMGDRPTMTREKELTILSILFNFCFKKRRRERANGPDKFYVHSYPGTLRAAELAARAGL